MTRRPPPVSFLRRFPAGHREIGARPSVPERSVRTDRLAAGRQFHAPNGGRRPSAGRSGLLSGGIDDRRDCQPKRSFPIDIARPIAASSM